MPTGMQGFVFDLGASWVQRPRAMKEDEFKSAKAELSKKVQLLMQMGKSLAQEKKKLADETRKMWMWSRWRAKSTLKSE